VTLVYTLTAPANIDVQVYGPEGRAVWGRRYAAGVAGGRVGYNTVAWDGRDTSGQYIGNGLYVYRIISGGRVLGTGYIIVLE
jgi:flagellar hook assembly protein FlgD